MITGIGVRPVAQPCWTVTFSDTGGHRNWIRLGPGTAAPCDELRMLAVDAPPNVGALSSMNLAAANIPSITIEGEVQYCFADLNGNGDRDFADILQVIANWGPCGGCNEDLDGDLVVGFAEILTIIGVWGPCPG